jgi:hypothetical protein
VEKICAKCQNKKDLNDFAKGSAYKDGRRGTCKSCHASYMKQYYYENPEKTKRKNKQIRHNWKKHRISEEQYNNLLSLYGGKCHSCKINNATSIDHNHACCPGGYSCGECVRGVLCHNCNSSLGLLKDSRQNIIGLLQYIDS